jgi:hypothetical protein
MDKNNPLEDRKGCMVECEKQYVRHTQKTFTGGVEALRRCREQCPKA